MRKPSHPNNHSLNNRYPKNTNNSYPKNNYPKNNMEPLLRTHAADTGFVPH